MLEKLPTETIEAMIETLPVDVTFIDEKDVIRYYSKGAEAIFKRSPKNIGMKVQDCHSPKSRPMVDKIISDLRAGRSNVVESWIDKDERKVHIRYFAVRDKACRYIGVLEVVQDITDIQKITGEKRP
jgi:PAS domain S-box-containing protein